MCLFREVNFTMIASQKLDPIDSVFWNLDTPTSPQTIGVVCLLDRSPRIDDLMSMLHERCNLFPRLVQKLNSNSRHGLSWETVSFPSIEQHIQVISDASIQSHDQLVQRLCDQYTTRFTFDEPLWQLIIVNGGTTPEGHPLHAAFFKIHHCFADGLGGLAFIETLLSDEPETAPAIHETNLRSEDDNGDGRSRSVLGNVFKFFQAATAFGSQNPTCPLRGTGSGRREITTRTLHLKDVRAKARTANTSVTCALLALTTAALRSYLCDRGVTLDIPQALIPVSLRTAEERLALGNKITGVLVPLPINLDSFDNQIKYIHDYFADLKRRDLLAGFAGVARVIAALPRFTHKTLHGLQAKKTTLICTTMPWVRHARYLCSAKVLQVFPLPALLKDHGMALGFISYNGSVGVSCITDPTIIPSDVFHREWDKAVASNL